MNSLIVQSYYYAPLLAFLQRQLLSLCQMKEMQVPNNMVPPPSPSKAAVPNLGPPDVLGFQLPEILASRGGAEGFWEL